MVIVLDKIDQKVVYELYRDARQSHKHIAHAIRTSKSTVTYRIQRLEKQGLISGYRTIIDYENLGIINCRAAFVFKNVTSADQQQIIKALESIPELQFIASAQGIADVVITNLSRSVERYGQVIDLIQKKIGRWVKDQEISFAREIVYCFPKLLFSQKQLSPRVTRYGSNVDQFTEFDHQLLNVLTNNPLCSIVDISKTLQCSSKKVLFHKKNLEKKNVILGYAPTIDFAKLGFDTFHVQWQVTDFSFEKQNKFKEYLTQDPQVIHITQALSSSNIECEVVVKNQRELYAWINTVKQAFPHFIEDYKYMLFYKVHKNVTYL